MNGGVKIKGIPIEWCLLGCILVAMFVLIAYATTETRYLRKDVQVLLKQNINQQKELDEVIREKNLLQEKLIHLTIRFDIYERMTNESFARVRGNFMAIGHGYHLEPKDMAPEQYWEKKQ